MAEAIYDGSLEGLFVILDEMCRGAPLPDQVRLEPGLLLGCLGTRVPEDPSQGDLFGTGSGDSCRSAKNRDAGGGAAKELFVVSANAGDDFVHGWMSELPIALDLLRFAWKVIAAARTGGSGRPGGIRSPEARLAAERAAVDRGDPAVAATLSAAYKVRREMDRLRGLLRFAPDSQGVYTAWCAPDHFVLPGLAEHFFRRFGDTSWAIVDEKRRIALACSADGEPHLVHSQVLRRGNAAEPSKTGEAAESPGQDVWTELWRNYHQAVNNESRRNPSLQRQFMPARYWKYLNEI
jgi:hypothetical protein